ncbi:MAG: sensor histidine kinase [Rhodocyclaceae bacterium]
MRRPLSLKRALVQAMLMLVLVLIAGYSLLAARYFLLGMDTVTADNLIRVARLAQPIEPDDPRPPPGFAVSPRWEDQPHAVRSAIPEPPSGVEQLSKGGRPPDTVVFAMRLEVDGEARFVSLEMSREHVSELVRRNAAQSLVLLLLIGLATLVALAAIVWWVLRRVSRPVGALGEWARGLDETALARPIPDFGYRDLNDFAALIRSSLLAAHAGMEREQRFLRYASHELRTPIGVIRSNIELLRKLHAMRTEPTDAREQAIVERLDRAGLTMKQLTETLLWLSREDTDALPSAELWLDLMIETLVDELRYLLHGKSVHLDLALTPCSAALPEAVTRIVLSNLIRNAFQHTWSGTVTIRQDKNGVHIINREVETSDDGESGDGADDLGFGLGLQLTEQLTRRLGWHYASRNEPRGRDVSITFGDDRPLPEQAASIIARPST